MSKTRGYCFTSFEVSKFNEFMAIKCRYVIIGKEVCPKSGKAHLQGYIYFENPRSFASVKKLLGKAHIEKTEGTPQDNRDYCSKGGDFEERGELPSPGKRNDIIALRDAIMEKKTDYEIITDDDLCPTYGRYLKFADRCREVMEREASKRFRTVDVVVLYGLAGTGKTRYVYDNENVDQIYTLVQAQKEVWFDGYCSHNILLIDDFYGWIKWGFLLKLLDGHQCRLNKKGSAGWACWNKVYITSNKAPWNWYDKGYPLELQRRIKKIIHFTENGTEVGGNTRPQPEYTEY